VGGVVVVVWGRGPSRVQQTKRDGDDWQDVRPRRGKVL